MKNGASESQNGDKIDPKRVRKGSRERLEAIYATEIEKRGCVKQFLAPFWEPNGSQVGAQSRQNGNKKCIKI